MSDELSQCCACFKEAIRVTRSDIRFDEREKERRIIFTLEIPYPFLSYFFCKKIPLSRRVGYVMDGSMDE